MVAHCHVHDMLKVKFPEKGSLVRSLSVSLGNTYVLLCQQAMSHNYCAAMHTYLGYLA